MSQRKDGQTCGKHALEFKLEAARLVMGGHPVSVTSKIPGVPVQTAILRQSALAQYLVSQLKFDSQRLWRQAFGGLQQHSATKAATTPQTTANKDPMLDTLAPALDAVTHAFFARVKPFVAAGQLVIAIDSDRSALYATGRIKPDPARARFIALAVAASAVVVDTEPLFRNHLAQSPLKLDVRPYDGHLNALGIKLVMQAAAAQLARP